MVKSQGKTLSPQGDRSRHLSAGEIARAAAALSPAPRDRGRIEAIVRRLPDGHRERLKASPLSVEEGVPGDDWRLRPPREQDAQLAVMQFDLARLIAGEQSILLFGDQLFVDLDLASDSLPTDSLIQVGTATVRVTPKPHNGCLKFKERFGLDALKFVSDPMKRSLNRRGVYWRVVQSGHVKVGDWVEVVSRPNAAGDSSGSGS